MPDNIESKLNEMEKFAEPASSRELRIRKDLIMFLSDLKQKYNGSIENLVRNYYTNYQEDYVKEISEMAYVDALKDVFYNIKVHNGSNLIRDDRARLVKNLQKRMEHLGLMVQSEIVEGKKPIDEAYLFWATYPNGKESFAALYEENLKKKINHEFSKRRIRNIISQIMQLNEQKNKDYRPRHEYSPAQRFA